MRTRGVRALERLADEELIAHMAGADPQAFEVLYQRHATVAYSLAYRITGTAGAAEDVTQDAFLSAWRSAGRFDATRGSVRTWVLSIVQHRAVDALRRRNPRERREVDSDDIAERLESPRRTDEEVADRQQADALRGLLADLPHEQRQVIVLAYFRGFTQTEIADAVDAPLGTVKGRMRLALTKLRAAALASEVGR
jgi:RNA polymerase sigma-70 factor (ECF subfamily)